MPIRSVSEKVGALTGLAATATMTRFPALLRRLSDAGVDFFQTHERFFEVEILHAGGEAGLERVRELERGLEALRRRFL